MFVYSIRPILPLTLLLAACGPQSDKERIAKEYGTTPDAIDKVMSEVQARSADKVSEVKNPESIKPQGGATPDYNIIGYCRRIGDIAGGSAVIERTCRDQEQSSLVTIRDQNIPKRIFEYCERIGRAAGESYTIFKTCVEQETTAASTL